ncbi:oligosaccharide flippase family protein [Porticoccaceae bacterium]|nr:oligosaccharide flippase family protein [Porticoccaceae bacterium]
MNAENIPVLIAKVLNLQVISRVIAFVTSIILARHLGVDLYGQYTAFFAQISLLMIPVAAGLHPLIVREVSRRTSESEGKFSGAIYWSGLHFKAITLIIFSSLVFLDFMLGVDIFDGYLLIAISIIYFKSSVVFKAAIINGFDKPVLSQLISNVIGPLGMCTSLLLIYIYKSKLSYDEAIYSLFFASLLTWLICNNIYRLNFRRIKLPSEFNIHEVTEFYRTLWPFFLMAAVGALSNEVVIIALGDFHSFAEASYFTIGLQAAYVILIIQNSTNSVLMPKISSNNSNFDLCNKLIKKSVRMTFVLAAPIFFTYVFFADVAVKYLYGIEYLNSVPILLILSTAQMINILCGPVGVVMNMMGNEKITLKCQIYSTMVGFGVSMTLLSGLGAYGVAIGVSLGLVIYNLVLCIIVKRKFGITTWIH